MAATPRVVPAQLSFLAIYNPTFGRSDESLQDQILFYSTRDTIERKQGLRERNAGTTEDEDKRKEEEEQNERLRQVGLAQGMIDFAKNFSNGKPIDSIETEKSRIVLHELEPGWWILASIDLTRLPKAALNADDRSSDGERFEYSTREVAPSQLLIRHLIQAHSQFLLHHAANFWDVYNRVGRDAFCSLLDKFWSKFIRNWDVLLHGNPAVDIYNGVKVSGCGELGIGVGEEEWGSGEREVLEGFVARTEGLVDLVVGRYGDAPVENNSATSTKKNSPLKQARPRAWLGQQESSRASDGIIFTGTGAVARRSLATVSQWMEAIFRDGDTAYGIGENPSSRPRDRRRRRARVEEKKPAESISSTAQSRLHSQSANRDEAATQTQVPRRKVVSLRRDAMENSAAAPSRERSPGIPPPLVGAVEASLARATNKVETASSPKSEKKADQATNDSETDSYFDTQKMMKYLSLGYGSSWTLNPKGLSSNTDMSTTQVESNGTQARIPVKNEVPDTVPTVTEASIQPELQQIDPTPEVSEDEVSFVQRLEQSIGRFLIGLSGDLENTEFDVDDPDNESSDPKKSQRIFLRTVTLEMSRSKTRQLLNNGSRSLSRGSRASTGSRSNCEPKTSAAASVDGAQMSIRHEKLQVAVYVHQPFIFIFLFELHKPSLTIPSFYRNIHHQLGPLQKPLLRSTDPSRIHDRLAEYMGYKSTSPLTDDPITMIHDLIYDPIKLTIRTTIPNIPPPGSLAAEGLNSSSSSSWSGSWYTLGIPISTSSTPVANTNTNLIRTDWTRIEALNVHTQILNTYISTHASSPSSDIERTVKTNRGWWIVWMQTIPKHPTDTSKEAFLVRKAGDFKVRGKGRETSGRWLLREQARDISGNSTGSGLGGGETSARGVGEGLGVDARRLVEGLGRMIQ